MARNPIRACVAVLLLPLASGCASTQLNYNTLDLASTTNSLLTNQVLYNFSSFLDSPVAIPAQVTISSGNATTSASIAPSFSTPLDTGLTATKTLMTAVAATTTTTTTNTATSTVASKTAGLNASDSWNQSWAYSPVTDPDRLKRLQALYRYAVTWSGELGGDQQFARSFPLIYKQASFSQPLCLQDMKKGPNFGSNQPVEEQRNLEVDPTKLNPTPTGKITVCVTAAGTPSSGLSHGATTKTYTRQVPDEHYLRYPSCIVCGPASAPKINPAIQGPWLHWRDLAGGPVDVRRLPRPDDILVGRSGHYEFYVNPYDAQRFVDFTVAVLAATTVAGSTGTTSATAGGSPTGSTPRSIAATDANGNIINFFIP